MKIFKTCKKHGALTYDDVYIRKTRKGMDCKHCSREYAKKNRKINPDKYQKHGKYYRKIHISPDTTDLNCSKCRQLLPLSFFSEAMKTNRYPYCKACMSKANKVSKIKHRETYEKYKIKNRVKAREKSMLNKYGIDLQQYKMMHELQNGVCKICKNPETSLQPNGKDIKDLCIDHCHKTNKVRGLLCHNCNAGIGHFNDNIIKLQSAINYLSKGGAQC